MYFENCLSIVSYNEITENYTLNVSIFQILIPYETEARCGPSRFRSGLTFSTKYIIIQNKDFVNYCKEQREKGPKRRWPKMKEKQAVLPDPSDVFSMMVISSAFEPRSASIEEKRRIFGQVWAKEIPALRSSFNSAGKDPKPNNYGFGFLVEAFVYCSNKLPRKNTKKGEEAAREIIFGLHSGKLGNIKLGSRQSNSDFLWVELTGRRVVVTGIGEIKSSFRAASQKIGGQLKRQETSLGYLADKFKSAKADNSISSLFKIKGIEIAENLEKFLIMPFGEGEKARRDGNFPGWQIVEIEFGYEELVFIAQQIWPDFRPDVQIGPGKLANLDKIAVRLGEWAKPRLDAIFKDSEEFGNHNSLPYFELGLFILATGKTPLLEDEVRWSAELVRNSFWPAVQRCLNFFLNSAPRPEADFSEIEKELFAKFWYVLTSNRADLEYFLYFIRSLNSQIKDLVREQSQLKQLAGMSEVWKI